MVASIDFDFPGSFCQSDVAADISGTRYQNFYEDTSDGISPNDCRASKEPWNLESTRDNVRRQYTPQLSTSIEYQQRYQELVC
jgi:hypothetical protein